MFEVRLNICYGISGARQEHRRPFHLDFDIEGWIHEQNFMTEFRVRTTLPIKEDSSISTSLYFFTLANLR